MQDRLLGKNTTITFDNSLEISLSGNFGTTVTSDLANRSIIIKLFYKEENANDRKFENPNLHNYIFENRENILSALYTLVRTWFENEMPLSTIPFASFPEWAAICGGILETCDFPNPINIRDDSILDMDTETNDMRRLFEFMYENHPDIWITRNKIKEYIRENDEVSSTILPYINLDEKNGHMRISSLIDKYAGRELCEITMVLDATNKTKSKQKVLFTKTQEKKQIDWNLIFDKKIQKSKVDESG